MMTKRANLAVLLGSGAFLTYLFAQPPGQTPRTDATPESFVARMMAFDANHDGKLTRAEITDERLVRVFDRADANHDGIVTKAELQTFYNSEASTFQGGGGPRGGPGGPGGFGGPGRGPGMRGKPGQVLPEEVQQMLNLTAEQKKSLAALQRDVDLKLDKMLTAAQKAQMKQMTERGPGPGGPPPDRN